MVRLVSTESSSLVAVVVVVEEEGLGFVNGAGGCSLSDASKSESSSLEDSSSVLT